MPSSKWCTIDSDPDIFRSLIKDFEAIGFDVKEVVELDMLPSNLMALIFCYRMDMEDYSPSFTEPIDLPTSLFFANQVISNACGTQAILHALLNIENLPEKCALGNTLENFKEFTSQMPYPVRGLCISNCQLFRDVHNGFARLPFSDELEQEERFLTSSKPSKKSLPSPSPLATTKLTVDEKVVEPPTKKNKKNHTTTNKKNSSKKKKWIEEIEEDDDDEDDDEIWVPEHVYHFVTYVPHAGKVWELNGLQKFPKYIGEFTTKKEEIKENEKTEEWTSSRRRHSTSSVLEKTWEEVVVKYLRKLMNSYEECNLEFSLLGIVPDTLPQLQTRLKELKQKAPTHPELAPEISQLEQQIQLENSFLEDSTISLRRMKFNYLPFIYKTFDILARHHPKEFSKLIKQALV